MSRLDVAQRVTLVNALVAGRGTLRSRILSVIYEQNAQIPLPADARLLRELDRVISQMLQGKVDEHSTTACAEAWEHLGSAWANRADPLAQLLVANGIPTTVVLDYIREIAGSVASPPAQVIEAVDAALAIGAAVTTACYRAMAHRQITQRQRCEFARGLLWGTLEPGERARGIIRHGLDPRQQFQALRARPAEGTGVDDISQAFGFVFGRSGREGICATVDRVLVGFLAQVPQVPVLGVCGLGPPRPMERLDESFRMASRALDTADRRGLTGVFEFAQLGLLPAITCDSAVGEALRNRYLIPLGESQSAAEIADTLHIFLLHGMNVGRTAKKMFIHPNTVRYRIGRFEQATGVSLRSSPVAMFEVLWALEHRSSRSSVLAVHAPA